jgi:hypothetical protein
VNNLTVFGKNRFSPEAGPNIPSVNELDRLSRSHNQNSARHRQQGADNHAQAQSFHVAQKYRRQQQ